MLSCAQPSRMAFVSSVFVRIVCVSSDMVVGLYSCMYDIDRSYKCFLAPVPAPALSRYSCCYCVRLFWELAFRVGSVVSLDWFVSIGNQLKPP